MSRLGLNFKLTKWRAITIAVVSGLLIASASYLIFLQQEAELKAQNKQEFLSIAKTKTKEINEWMKERKGDAAALSANMTGLLLDGLALDSKIGKSHQNTIEHLFYLMQNAQHYEEIQLIALDGEIVFATDQTMIGTKTHEFAMTFIGEHAGETDTLKYGLYHCVEHQSVHFDMVTPVFDSSKRIVGYVLLRMNPEDHLFPSIVSWPTKAKTAESFVVKEDGEEVVFLNKLANSEAPPLSFRINKSEKNILSVQAILGLTGFYEGTDYRNQLVFALVEPIPLTPWYMIVKIDLHELYEPLKREAKIIFGFAGALILLVVLVIMSLYSSLQRQSLKKLFAAEQLFKTTLYSIGDAVIVTNEKGIVLNMNQVAERLTGYMEQDAQNKPIENIFNIENETSSLPVENPIRMVIERHEVVEIANHSVLISKQGTKTPIADSGAPINNSDGKLIGVVLVFRDQTKERDAREKLQKSEERLKLVSEATDQGVWDWNVKQNTVYYSDQWMRQIGYEPGELEQNFETWQAHLHPDDYQKSNEAVSNFLANPIGKFRLEFRFRHKDQSYRWIRNLAEASMDQSGQVERMYGAHVDVTAEKEAAEKLRMSEERFRSIFESSPLGKSITGLDGSMSINTAFSDILGYELQEVKNKKWQEITHPDDVEASATIVQSLIDGQRDVAIFEKRYIHKDGHYIWTEVHTTLLRDKNQKPVFFITSIQDITQRKMYEQQINDSKLKLEGLNNELLRSNQELEQFAYVASHDLQEPLRMVSSYTQLLQKRYKDQLDANAHEFIHFAVDGAIRMQGLINDLLDYSRVTTRGKALSKVSLMTVLAQARLNLKTKITETSALIINTDLPDVIGDEGQLVRVFQNLTDNAIKYCNDTTPMIHFSAAINGRNVTISVQDNGIGIDMKFSDRVFVIFQRLHSRDKYGGTGIGLAICKRIIERHGGKIWLESEPGKGTTFYFTLNLA